MTTNGSFTPPGQAPCVQTVDRAALLALRAANGLDTNCHYIIPGPTIGTAGNTSPTTIELHATAADELALEAKVHTDFHTTAWAGLFDIDLGTAGTLLELSDHRGNVVHDEAADAPTVHTQWPWHNNNVRANECWSSVLPGWGDLTTQTVSGNNINDSTVDFTGAQSFMFMLDNEVRSSFFQLRANTGFIRASKFYLASVDGASTSRVDITTSEFRTSSSSLNVDAADTEGAAVMDCNFNGYQISLARTGGNTARFTASNFIGTDYAGVITGYHAVLAGTGAVGIHECDFRARSGTVAEAQQLTIDGSGPLSMVRVRLRDSGVNNFAGIGSINGIVRTAASSGGIDVADIDWFAPVLYMSGTGSLDFGMGSLINERTTFRHEGGSLLSLQGCTTVGTAFVIGAGSTGTLLGDMTHFTGGTITKNGTAPFTFSRLEAYLPTFTQNATSLSPLNCSDSHLELSTVMLAAGSSGAVFINAGNTGRVNLNHSGNGGVQVQGTSGNLGVNTATGSTRSVIVLRCTGQGSVSQSGTGTTAQDMAVGVHFQDGTVNFASTLGGTGANNVSGTVAGGAVVNVADGAVNAVSQTLVSGGSVLNVQPGGSVSHCRFDAGVTANTGAFAHTNSIAEGTFVLTATAANSNALLNKAYSDWI